MSGFSETQEIKGSVNHFPTLRPVLIMMPRSMMPHSNNPYILGDLKWMDQKAQRGHGGTYIQFIPNESIQRLSAKDSDVGN